MAHHPHRRAHARIEAFGGLVRPALFKRTDCHEWWNDRNYWEVVVNLNADLPPPMPFFAPSTTMMLPPVAVSSYSS
jgi:hypothetical protein